jgi:phosphate-selective porin OprO/OprP
VSNTYVSAVGMAAIATLMAPSIATAATNDVDAIRQQVESLQTTLAEQQRVLQQQAAEIQQLRQQLQSFAAAGKERDEPQRKPNEQKLGAQEAPRTTMTGPRPIIASADGSNTLAPRALVQFDMADYGQDRDSGAAADFRRGSVGTTANRETNGARDFSDGAYFRRARFGFEGIIARDFNYRILLELGGSGTEGPTRINDAWISYSGFAPFTVQLGAFSPAANMDDSTSAESLVFIERASAAELSRGFAAGDGRIGLGVRSSGDRWMTAFTLTSRTVSDAEVFDAQLAAVGRAGFLLSTSPDHNIHAGFSGTWVEDPADQGAGVAPRTPLRFRDRPEIRIDSTRLIDTGTIAAESGYVAGVEFGANWKNVYFQAENFWYGIDRPEGSSLSDPSFGGYYAQTSWILTGESRRYDIANASFQNPRPFVPFSSSGGLGAWELAVRYSKVDLNHHEGSLASIALEDAVRGGEQSIWTFGINWYVNSNLRFLFNYLRVDVDRLNPGSVSNPLPFGPAPATPPAGVQIGQELDVYALRSQFSF